jgi:uncharacterized protein YndB with AHSA1/START domain
MVGTPIGPLAVRRSVWINASPDRVWREFETFVRMRAWFGTGHRLVTYEPREGGWVELEIDASAGHPTRFGGKIVVFEPPRELTFEDAWIPDIGWAAPMLLTLRLTPHLGGTHVELFVHQFERLGPSGPDEHRGFEGGWTTRQLNRLKVIVEGAA